MLLLIIWFVVAIICATVGGILAEESGRGAAGFWLGLFFGSIGIVIALLLTGVKKADYTALTAAAADLNALIANRGKVGIGISPKDGRTIASVTPGSSAHESGIKVGDRVIAIDRALCAGDYRAVVLGLVGDSGSQVHVSVRRGTDSHDYVLVRR